MIKEKINKFVAAYCSEYGVDKDDLVFLESKFDAFRTYVNVVTSMEYKIPIMRFRLEGEEYREAVAELDRHRRICHEDVIGTCSYLNRVSGMLGLEPFYEGDINDRYQVAEFAGEFVEELYQRGISPSRETIIEQTPIIDVDTWMNGEKFDREEDER